MNGGNGKDKEANRLGGRMARYARVGASIGGVAARYGAARMSGRADRRSEAAALRAALGGLKGAGG